MNFNLYEFHVAGEPLQVGAVFWEALEGPAPPETFECDGCSRSPDFYRTWTLKSYKLWPACIIHDFHYRTGCLGGNWKARWEADRIFRQNMVTLLRMQGAGAVRQRTLSWLYWGRVRIWGASSYRGWADGEEPLNRLQRFREVYGLFKDNGKA